MTDNAIFLTLENAFLGRNSGERYRSCVWRAVLEAFRLIFIFAPLRLNDFEHEQGLGPTVLLSPANTLLSAVSLLLKASAP